MLIAKIVLIYTFIVFKKMITRELQFNLAFSLKDIFITWSSTIPVGQATNRG